MSTLPNARLTAEEYLTLERAGRRKSEYFDGQMYLMAGAQQAHNLRRIESRPVAVATLCALHRPLRHGDCKTPGGKTH